MSITLHQGSILDSKADTIVNPANSFLMHGGGLARVISDAASAPFDHNALRKPGEAFVRMSVAEIKALRKVANEQRDRWIFENSAHSNVATGDACWTSAGRLPYKGIVHAVGPIYKNGKLFERQLLASAHSRAIAVAQEHGCTSIAFPAISTGIFGYPIAEAAEVAVRQCAWHNFPIEFWLFSDEDYAAYEIALGDVPVIR